MQQEEALYFWCFPVKLRVRFQKVQNSLRFKKKQEEKTNLAHEGTWFFQLRILSGCQGRGSALPGRGRDPAALEPAGIPQWAEGCCFLARDALCSRSSGHTKSRFLPIPGATGELCSVSLPPVPRQARLARFSPEAIKRVLLSAALRKPPAILQSVNETFLHATPTYFC